MKNSSVTAKKIILSIISFCFIIITEATFESCFTFKRSSIYFLYSLLITIILLINIGFGNKKSYLFVFVPAVLVIIIKGKAITLPSAISIGCLIVVSVFFLLFDKIFKNKRNNENNINEDLAKRRQDYISSISVKDIKEIPSETVRKKDYSHLIPYYTIFDVDSMNGPEFENFTVDLLKQLDYCDVKATPVSNDYGVDVLAEKNGQTYAIQCKRYSQKVNNSSVQEVAAGKDYYNCDCAAVLTNNYFTNNAIQLAEKINVSLWDRDTLQKMIREAYPYVEENQEYIPTNEELSAVVNANIAFGAVMQTENLAIINSLRDDGLIKPFKQYQYPEFTFTESEWNNCDRNLDKIKKYIKDQNIWYNKSLKDIDRCTESDFIIYVCEMLEGLGFANISRLKNGNDVDVICEKENLKYAFKCKHSISSDISIQPIRNMIVGKNQNKCHIGVVITNSFFSQAAKDIAESNTIVLIDRNKLLEIINGKYTI